MTAELLARVSPGLAMQLGQPGDNPGMWFKLLLQAQLSDLGEEYGMPMRTLALNQIRAQPATSEPTADIAGGAARS